MSTQHLDAIFAALADSTRRDLVHALAEGEKSIGDLAAPFDMSLAAVSKHIKVLEQAGIIQRRIDGRTHYCSLLAESLTEALDWISIYRHFWLTRLENL
ncbi:MAG: transcriptional regulator [Lysobacteraceae bacterium]|nr:MAG: transcriptional regulator [Xanthomonadaceae bacterium]